MNEATPLERSEPKDVREMRQRINRAAYGRERVDGKDVRDSIPPAGALINAIMNLAQRDGWSGEDTMTALAYHALVQYESMYDRVLDGIVISPMPSTILQRSQP